MGQSYAHHWPGVWDSVLEENAQCETLVFEIMEVGSLISPPYQCVYQKWHLNVSSWPLEWVHKRLACKIRDTWPNSLDLKCCRCWRVLGVRLIMWGGQIEAHFQGFGAHMFDWNTSQHCKLHNMRYVWQCTDKALVCYGRKLHEHTKTLYLSHVN